MPASRPSPSTAAVAASRAQDILGAARTLHLAAPRKVAAIDGGGEGLHRDTRAAGIQGNVCATRGFDLSLFACGKGDCLRLL
jgi:hypothetical protein